MSATFARPLDDIESCVVDITTPSYTPIVNAIAFVDTVSSPLPFSTGDQGAEVGGALSLMHFRARPAQGSSSSLTAGGEQLGQRLGEHAVVVVVDVGEDGGAVGLKKHHAAVVATLEVDGAEWQLQPR